jgi:heavy metal sensor kinase
VPRKVPERKITRTLRFRLTAAYTLIFTLVLALAALLFRESLKSSLEAQAQDVLNQEWAAMKGYLQIKQGQWKWEYDPTDPDEAKIVEGIRGGIYLFADAQGKPIEFSTDYQELGIDSPAQIQRVIQLQRAEWTTRHTPSGAPIRIRAGVVYDEGARHRVPYFVAIGRNQTQSQALLRNFTTHQMWLIPLMAVAGCILGWVLAGQSLRPVLAVAQTAQRITGSNLSLRIPARGAGDELDYLILTFNRMIERLESSFQQVRQFSTDVSHELRTPITAIRGQLEVAMFTAKTAEQYQEAILNALQDIERLSQIVRALLLLSQAESGQLVLRKTRLDLVSVVRDIVDQFQIPAEAQGVGLESVLPAACAIDADRVQIERMLSNLLSNAVKFTPAGGRVCVLLRAGGDDLELTVEDTGCGIPLEAQPHIFERFYRVRGREDESSPEKGLGLGLSFVAWIVKAHGGDINVESKPGAGSRFVVRLPAAPSPPALSSAPTGTIAVR